MGHGRYFSERLSAWWVVSDKEIRATLSLGALKVDRTSGRLYWD